MPQLLAVVFKVAVTALIKIGVSKGIAVLVTNFVIKLAISAAASAIMRALTPKPKGMDQGAQLQTKIDPAASREVAVGPAATGGSLVFEGTEPPATLKYYWRVIAISDKAINSVIAVLGNGDALTFSGDLTTGWRDCTSHFIKGSTKYLRVRVYTGEESQTADADLIAAFSGKIDSNFRGRGIAYAIVRMEYSTEVWPNGLDLVWVVEGAEVYDVRTLSYAYRENPVLIGREFLTGFYNNGVRVVGLGVADDDLPDADYEAGADECDEVVDKVGGGTEARYRMGGMISSRETAREILSHIVASMGGEHVDRGGQIVLLPGVARTAVMDIDEGELLADAGITFAAKRPANERVNAINSTFINPLDSFQEAPLPVRKDAAAITADGDRFDTTRAYRFVFSKSQGQRLDEQILRAARKEGYLQFTAPLWAFELTPGDPVTMTNKRWGNVEKTWKVESLDLVVVSGMAGSQASARCAITFRETAASVYGFDADDDGIDEVESGAHVHDDPLHPNFDNLGRLNGAYYSGNPLITGAVAIRDPIEPMTAADVGATATITIADFVLKISRGPGESLEVEFDGGSCAGLAFSTGYHVFAYDPEFDGGSVTYFPELTSDLLADPEYLYIGPITTPADGGGGTSGTGGGGFCVAADSFMADGRRAAQVCVGDMIEALTPDFDGLRMMRVTAIEFAVEDCVRVITESGADVEVSCPTRLEQPDHSLVRADESVGARLMTKRAGVMVWETIARAKPIGPRVVAKISAGECVYAAGRRRDVMCFTHNIKPLDF